MSGPAQPGGDVYSARITHNNRVMTVGELLKENELLRDRATAKKLWWPGMPVPAGSDPKLLEADYVATVMEETHKQHVRRDAGRLLDMEGRGKIALVPAAEIRGRSAPPYLIDGMMPAYGIGVLFGESGVYKSFLALNLLLCIGSQSAAFLGHMVNSGGGGHAVYVMGEGQYDAGLRLSAAIASHAGFADDRLHYIEQAFPLSDDAAVDEVIARCRELQAAKRFSPPPGWPVPPEGWVPGPGWKPEPSWPDPPEDWELMVPDDPVPVRLVVFDSFADFYGAGDNENSSTDMQRLVAGMKRISAALGCVVMANAHTGHGGTDEDGEPKPPPTRLRGSSRFRQAFDFEWMATGKFLVCTKNRYGPLFSPVPYKLVPAGGSLVLWEGTGEPPASGEEPERAWHYPVKAEQMERVLGAVVATPGMNMTAVTAVAKVQKAMVSVALAKWEGNQAIENAGTKGSPKYVPGPAWRWWAGTHGITPDTPVVEVEDVPAEKVPDEQGTEPRVPAPRA